MSEKVRVSLKPLQELAEHLTVTFVGREQEVLAALTALAAGEPAFFCGPPGTAKTALIEEMARCLNARYFYYLLTRFTEPDELLGPLNVAALREGRWERVSENRLPTADIVFLDEVFKAGSAILNTLLDVILNRRILNGTTYVQLPLLALYTASNEVTTDADLMAFYDRLLVRSFIQYVSDDMLDDLLSRGVFIDTGAPRERPQIPRDYIIQLQRFVSLRAQVIAADAALREKIIKAFMALREKGIVLSDRRKVKLIKTIAAVSTVMGEEKPSPSSVGAALLLTAPHDEEELPKVREVIIKQNLAPFDPTAYYTLLEEGLKLAEGALEKVQNGSLTLRELQELRGVRGELAKIYNAIPANLFTFSFRAKLYSAIKSIDEVLLSVSGGSG
ncbi:MAG: AAA family ATPase [Thermofilaceae archaeon]